jgi:hypothetical protein
MTIECYSQRLLNPYRGTMQVIRSGSAEAVSLDGVRWDIYVANDSLLEGLGATAGTQVSDIRYGAWSVERGLKRGPIYPSEDFRRMEAQGARVYEALRQRYDQLPFPLRDRDEYWLLDLAGHPLALLHSALDAQQAETPTLARWTAGRAARARFRPEGCVDAAARVETLVNQAAGEPPVARWYRRRADGAGMSLDGADVLPAESFPECLCRAPVARAEDSRLIEAYHAWTAVWLLCLPTLGRETRRYMEGQARLQADLVDGVHRLYPEVIDPALINAARVEARLGGGLSGEDEGGAAQPTYYIELNPQGGGYT